MDAFGTYLFLVSSMTPVPIQFLFSENINIYLQSLGNHIVDNLFLAITNLGSGPAFVFLASIILWCFNKKTGIRVMYAILFSAFSVIFIKNLFGMPRPPEYLHKIKESGFGFPSGHAQVSSSFWGYLGCKIRDAWIIFIGAATVLSVSLSRVYLGVHYVGDVIGGIFIGLMLALVFFKTESIIVDKLKEIDQFSKYFVAVIVPAILIAVAYMQIELLKEQIERGLLMAGIGVGYLLENEHIRLEDTKNNKQRIKRAIVGILLMAIVYLISNLLIVTNPNFIFFRYAALGFASTFVAPWLILKIEVKNQKST